MSRSAWGAIIVDLYHSRNLLPSKGRLRRHNTRTVPAPNAVQFCTETEIFPYGKEMRKESYAPSWLEDPQVTHGSSTET